MRTNKLHLPMIFILAGLFLVATSSLSAREASDEDAFELEEIKVTAEKREVNVQDTAISITAFTGADIRDKSLLTIGSALSSTPGVLVQGNTVGRQIFIRGVGSNVSTNLSDPAVAVTIDNVYAGRTESPLADMYDVERLEVLRGPQGTLHGRNAEGGAVRVITNAPKDEIEAVANFRIGDYNLKHLDGVLNTPTSEKSAARFAFLRETRDGYLSDGGMNSDRFSARGKFSYKPTDDLSFLATVDYSLDKSFNVSTVPTPGSAGNLPPMPWNDDIGTEGWALPEGSDPWTNDEYHYGEAELETTIYSLQIEYDLKWAQLTLTPTYTDYTRFTLGELFMGTGIGDGTLEGQTRNFDQWTGEITLSSPAGNPVSWVAGFYLLESEYEEDRDVTDPLDYGDDDWHFITYNHPAETYAVFGQITYPLTDRLRATGGLRYSIDKRALDYRYGNADVPVDDPLYSYTNGTGVYDSGIVRYEDDAPTTTYKAGIEFDFSEATMLYAQVATGFKQGGLNAGAPPTEFDPEEVVAYEIGSKSRLFGNRMQVNLELFYYDYNNFQVACYNEILIGETGDVEGTSLILNAEKGTNKGGEVEFDYLLTTQDRIKMNVAYLNAKYGEITIPANPTQGMTEDFPLDGEPVTNSPEWTGSLGYQHIWILDDGAQITSDITTRLSSGYYTTLERWQAEPWQDSYHRSDVSVNYTSPDGKKSLSIWCKNIENDAQTTIALPFYRRIITDPRTVGVNISFRY